MSVVTEPPAAVIRTATAAPIEAPVQQHSLPQSIALHLAPGIAAGAVYTAVAYVTTQSFALYAEVFLGAVPFMLGWLLYAGYARGARRPWRAILSCVPFRQPLPRWQYGVLVPLLMLWAIVVFAVAGTRASDLLLGTVFSWLPAWFVQPTDLAQYSRPALLAMLLVEIAAAGIAAPIVEELYFRGYLLPRIARLGVWAPVLGTVLFALYHFHSPWLALNRIVAVLPLTYVAYWKKNVIPGAIAHCLLNVLSTLVVFAPLLMKP